MKIIAGIDKNYQGEVVFAPGYSVGYLEQEPQLDDSKTVKEIVEEGCAATVALLKENEELKRSIAERNSRIEHQNQEISRLLSERDVERATAQNLRSQLAERVEEAKEQVAAQRCAYEERLQEAKEQSLLI